MPRFRIILFFYFFINTYAVCGQQFGGNPPSLKWKQINTDTARVIFPVGLESQAQQVASIVEALSKSTLQTAGGRQHKIDIVFQNQTTISNGYVSLAPFRSEFQLTAEQNSFELGSLPWQQQLAIHEYRHVQQYNNYRIGLSKIFYYLFGEGGQDLANSLSIPNWFWEGDAVYQETLVSKQGRGRLPFFFNGYRSMWVADKNYSYLKLRNGSLRDYVPDHYPIGYMLVSFGRNKYGDDFWRKVTLDAASFKGPFYPLQRGVEKYAGISFNQFTQDALNFFKGQLSTSAKSEPPANFARNHKHFVADEEFPQFIDDQSIVYVRTTYKKIPTFMKRNLKTGREEAIKIRSISLDNYFSANKNKIVYAAYETDPRWNWRDFSVIRILDIQTKKDRKLTRATKYFSPDISADGRHIVTVNVGADGRCDLIILKAQNGRIEKIIPNKENLFYTYPKFYNDSEIVSAVRNRQGQMAMGIFNINDGTGKYITAFSMNVMGFPSVAHDTVYFTASHRGQDQLFSAAGGRLFSLELPIRNSSTGIYQLQEFGGKFVWNIFTAVGFTEYHSEKNEVRFREITAGELGTALLDQGIYSLGIGPKDLLDKITYHSFPVTNYPSSFKIFNFHSWRPYINDPDYNFALVSENVLSTLQSNLYIDYNRNERYKQIGADATYAQLFPWFDGGISYTFDRNTFYGTQKIYWNEAQERIGFSIPLNLTRAGSYTNLQWGSDIIDAQRYYRGVYKDSFSTKGFAYIDPYLNFSNQIQQTSQQIYPRLAQTVTLSYDRTVTNIRGNQFLASGNFYFPGIFLTNNLVLSAAFQQRDSLNQVSFSNSFPFSRGYSGENFYRMYRFAGNYHFPLFYPDWGLGNVVYFLRIRANLYYDYTNALDFLPNGSKFQALYRSYGTEIYFDTKWWNQLSINFGIRYSRLIDPDFEGRGPNQWEFILPINLLSN
jgi:hypothetical protein